MHDALASAARAGGADIRTGVSVARVLVRDYAVTGVVLDSAEEVFAGTVVSTADPVATMLGLVDPVWLDPEFIHAMRNIKLRGSTAYVNYAVDKLPAVEGLDSGVSLTPEVDALERAHDAAKYGQLAESPHIELTAISSRWPGLAPAGKHVIVARVEFAPIEVDATHVADVATWEIERRIPRFADTVLHREVMTPADIERSYALTDGAASQGALMLDQILFMRPVPGWAEYAMPVDGLYLGGVGAHPGPGVIGGAGWLAASRVLRDMKAAPRRQA
jgi:phytoene dehydrogenase-like protein